MERDAQFIEEVVKMLVDNPDDVKVNRKIDEMGVLISLDVNQEDMGMVIGREGSTAKALRTLLRVIGARNNARVNLKINEPEGSTHVPKASRDSEGSQGSQGSEGSQGSHEPREPEQERKKSLDEVVGDIQI